MSKILKKIKQQPEGVRKTIAGVITIAVMAVIIFVWVKSIKNNFDLNFDEVKAKTSEDQGAVSPLSALIENFKTIVK